MPDNDLPTEFCARCRFARSNGIDDGLNCHRYPPRPLATLESFADTGVSQGIFPGVDDNQWCGEFERVPEALPKQD